MYRKETIFLILVMILVVTSGCSDSSKKEEKNVQNNTITDNSNTTKEDSNKEDNSNDDSNDNNVTPNAGEEAVDDYNVMMSYVEQIQSDFTEEQVVEIMGEPDSLEGSGIVRNYYNFGEYKVRITYASDGLLLYIINNTTGEKTKVYP